MLFDDGPALPFEESSRSITRFRIEPLHANFSCFGSGPIVKLLGDSLSYVIGCNVGQINVPVGLKSHEADDCAISLGDEPVLPLEPVTPAIALRRCGRPRFPLRVIVVPACPVADRLEENTSDRICITFRQSSDEHLRH